MGKIILNLEQIKKIKKIIKPLGLTFDQYNSSITTIDPPKKRAYRLYCEFDDLLQANNNEKIHEILKLITAIKEVSEEECDSKYYGKLIKDLKNVNPEDFIGIFIVFTAIVNLYETIILSELAKSDCPNDFNKINMKKKEILHSETTVKEGGIIKETIEIETEEERKVKQKIDEILKNVDDIIKGKTGKSILCEPILKSLIEKCNSSFRTFIKLNVIWNTSELSKIKKYLRRFNLSFNDNLELISWESNLSCTASPSKGYGDFAEEISGLFYLSDASKINQLFEKIDKLEFPLGEQLQNSLISVLFEIKQENNKTLGREKIFKIFQEIVGQYFKIIDEFVQKNYGGFSVEELEKKLEDLIDDSTTEEQLIRNLLERNVFIFTNDIQNSELFKPLVIKLDSIIKNKIIEKIKAKITNIKSQKIKTADRNYHSIRGATLTPTNGAGFPARNTGYKRLLTRNNKFST